MVFSEHYVIVDILYWDIMLILRAGEEVSHQDMSASETWGDSILNKPYQGGIFFFKCKIPFIVFVFVFLYGSFEKYVSNISLKNLYLGMKGNSLDEIDIFDQYVSEI